MAGQIEIFGKLTILALGMPVLTALLETIGSSCHEADGPSFALTLLLVLLVFGLGTRIVDAAETDSTGSAAGAAAQESTAEDSAEDAEDLQEKSGGRPSCGI